MTADVLPAAESTAKRDRSVALRRLLVPQSIALVGLSDTSVFGATIKPTLASGVQLHMVNPRYESVWGLPTVPSLTEVGAPVDAVMSFMSAERTVALVEEAAGLDVGGLVLVAGGFAETSPDGAAMQQRMLDAASRSGLEIVGPNGLGYINVPHKISLTIASAHHRRPGGISVISQSGAMLSGVAMAAWAYRGCGLNVLVSAGNEAVTDLAAYVDYLVDDPETSAIGLVIEKVRRPEAFFAAARRAAEAGKPIVALKLARSKRTQQMAASHTGSLTGDAWVYDVALKQAGIEIAYDPEELVDRLALFDQIPVSRRSAVENLAVVTMTGGFASLSADLAEAEGMTVPALEEFGPWIRENLPGITVPNPLDTTGLGGMFWPQIVDMYGTSDSVDAVMVIHPVADEDEGQGNSQVEELGKLASRINKPTVLANCSGVPGEWTVPLAGPDVAAGRGLRPTLRGLASLGRFHRFSRDLAPVLDPVATLPRPAATPIAVDEGLMLPFAAGMDLLAAAGIPTAAYRLIPADAEIDAATIDLPQPWVAKLADVAHRTEHDAVRIRVTADTLAQAVADLRGIAARDGLPAVIAVQPMVGIEGEAFVGVQGASELGPLVAFGIGGVLVEAINRVGGRLAPFDDSQAHALIDEFRDIKLMHGFRGKPAWDHAELARILVAAGNLAAGGASWINSLDINPLVWTGSEFLAVDALMILTPDGQPAGDSDEA